jgi:hypothetical protein
MVDTARRAVAELAASQHRAFTRKQAATLDFDYRRVATALRAGWLDEPVPGVLTLREGPPTWEQRLQVVVLACGGHGAASHRAAARLHALDGFDSPHNAAIEASVSRTFRLDPAVSSVVHHVTPFDPTDLTIVTGIRCTTVERTLVDLGSVVRGRKPVRRALTSARRKGLDLAKTRSVAERLHRPGQAGTGVLLRLLDSVSWEGTLPQTWFEELLGLCLDDPSLPPRVPQCPIRDEHGRIVARTDIGIPAVRLGIEAHSRTFHFGPDAGELDEDRDIAATRCGWELMYLGWYATRKPAAVLEIIRDVVRVRARELRECPLSAEV